MNISTRTVAVLAVSIVLLVLTVEAWFTSPRTHRYVTEYRLVECYCDVICEENSNCTWNCPNACSNGKRSVKVVRHSHNDKKHDVKGLILPCKFEAWDVDGSGGIIFSEFVFSSHTGKDDRTGRKLFKVIDKDGSGTLSRSEFTAAPILREKC